MKIKHKTHKLAICLVIGGAAFINAPQVFATTLFQDDFESYASGSNLIGQNGWASPFGGFTMQIDPGSGLPSQVVNGRHAFGNIHYAFHSLSGALDLSEINTLTFDGYGTSATPASTNSGVGLQPGQGVFLPLGSVWWDINHDSGGWSFDARGITGDYNDLTKRFTIPGYYDQAGHFSIILDGKTNEVYGTADFGSGIIQTPHFAVSDAALSALNNVLMFQDYQTNAGRLGAEFDNISVSNVPIPTAFWLFGSGMIGLFGFKNRSKFAAPE